MKNSCPDCDAAAGEVHDDGCAVERCPRCGNQRVSCGCPRRAVSKFQRQPWSGEWPGLAECREFGWWCLRNPRGAGYVPVPEGTPGALEDMNRLATEARWDRDKGRWVLR